MKTNIRSLIIDDEPANHLVLENLLGRHCTQVQICGNAFSAAEGCALIAQHCPDLIFLDIKMPGVSGLEMLRLIEEIHFDVIFISGFDEYAIQAFEFNAVDYVLKPIDYVRLITAVERAEERIRHKKGRINNPVIHFIRSLDERSHVIRRLTLHQHEKVHVVDLDDVVCIRSVGSCSEVVTTANRKFVSARPLGDYELVLAPLGHFFRVNRNMLINADHIGHYTKGSNCFITMKYIHEEIEVSRRRKTAILAALNRMTNLPGSQAV